MTVLEIKDLHASVGGRKVLDGITSIEECLRVVYIEGNE